MMHRVWVLVAGACLLAPAAARATTIDFETTAPGAYNALVFPDVTITFLAGNGMFDVVDNGPGNPGPPLSGHALLSYNENPGPGMFNAQFTVPGVRSVSIDTGDYDADQDHGYLAVYNAANVLLGMTDYINPADRFGGATMTVNTAEDIAYARFWDANDTFPGAVYWDNLAYEATAVPEPASLLLLGAGLFGAAARRRRA